MSTAFVNPWCSILPQCLFYKPNCVNALAYLLLTFSPFILIPGCPWGPFNWSKPQSPSVRKVTFTLTVGAHSHVLLCHGSPRDTSKQRLTLAWIPLEFLLSQFQTHRQRNDFLFFNLDCCVTLWVLRGKMEKSLLKKNLFSPLKLRSEFSWTWPRKKKEWERGQLWEFSCWMASRRHGKDVYFATY